MPRWLSGTDNREAAILDAHNLLAPAIGYDTVARASAGLNSKQAEVDSHDGQVPVSL
jgi:hypothetical protein